MFDLRTVAFAFLAIGPGILAPGQNVRRLSLAEAERLAQLSAPTARAAAARLRGADARLRGAGSFANPNAVLAPHFGRNTGGLDEDVTISQSLEMGDKRRQRLRAASAERDAATADQQGSQADIAFQTRSAYYEALRADAERDLARERLAAAKAFVVAAEVQFQAGDVPRSNVVRSRIEQVRAEQDLSSVEKERDDRYAALRSLAGLPESAELDLTDNLTFEPLRYEPAAVLALAMENRPDIRAARLLRASREAALHGARARTQPDIFLEGRHSTLDPAIGGSSLRLGIALPLLDLGQARAESAAAVAALDEQQAVLDETVRLARLEVESANRALDFARRAVQSFQTGRLDQARQLLDMAQTGYERGATSLIELIDARQVYRAEQLDYARALASYNVAVAALQRALGGRLP